nr:aquaporin [Klebsiella pneumoniae]
MKTQPATGETYPKSDLFNKAVTNTSVNPARSTAVAIFQGGWALQQLWLFWVMPIVGGILGGVLYRTLLEKRD